MGLKPPDSESFQGTRLRLLYLRFAPLLGRAVGRTPGSILDLDVLLNAGENVPHFGDLVLHQTFVGVSDLQPIDERDGSYAVVAVVY